MTRQRRLDALPVLLGLLACSSNPLFPAASALDGGMDGAADAGPDRGSLGDAGGYSYVILHAQVYGSGAGVDAAAIRGSSIAALGSSTSLSAACTGSCVTIEANGGFLAPGFHDAHCHLFTAGQDDTELQVSGSNRVTIQAALGSWAAAHPTDPWILGQGWSLFGFGTNLPTAADLDAVVPNRPVALVDSSLHNLWANTAAMSAAGVTAATLNPPGGRIVHDAAGNPTGLFINANSVITAAEPALTKDQIDGYLETATAASVRNGFTAVQGGPISLQVAEEWGALSQSGTIAQRAFVWGNLDATDAEFQNWLAFAKSIPPSARFQVTTFKGFVDGVLGASTAALLAPYSDDPSNTGLLIYTQAKLNALVQRANAAGFPVTLHAIGDAAVRAALDAFEASSQALGTKLLNRVEHASVVDPADVPRFAALGVAASEQPSFTYFPSTASCYLFPRLGTTRINYAYPWNDLNKSGAFLLFGTDYPAGDPAEDPVTGLYSATQRTFADGTPFETAQAIDPESAMEAFTIGPAKAVGLDGELGKIAVGYQADLVLLDHDPIARRSHTVSEDPVRKVLIAGVLQ